MTKLFSSGFYKKCLKKGLGGMMLCFLFSAILLMFSLFFYPNIAESGIWQGLQEMLQVFPTELLARFGLSSIPDFSDYHHFLSACMQIQLLIGCFFALYLGTSSLIRYESDHTIIFLYAHPISRTSIVLNKLLCQFTLLFLYNIGVFFIAYLMSAAFVYNFGSFLLVLLRIFFAFLLIELLYLAIGVFFSTLLTHSSQCSSTAFMLFLSTLLFGILGRSIGGLEWLALFSPYYYFETYPLLCGDAMPIGSILICLLVSAAAVGGACLYYRKKDFIL